MKKNTAEKKAERQSLETPLEANTRRRSKAERKSMKGIWKLLPNPILEEERSLMEWIKGES
jgi:hypothetical protein